MVILMGPNWGRIYLLYGILGLFGLSTDITSPSTFLALPIAVQEMVFAVWLIVKGFNPSAIAPDLQNN